MATNTSGGTTASLSNTPQAQDDSFNLVEDYNAIAWLDVMGNDLGGNAKILWSLDDSATDAAGATDLIGSDIGKVEATTNDTSLNGAKIWICDGKVGYDASTLSASFRAQLQALAVGEHIYDSFTYAIRMSNGTLSWATATVVYTGTNDGPDISVATGDSASACLSETDSALSTNGTLTVVDPDTSDTVAVSITGFSKSGNAGSLSDATLQGMLALTESSLAANTGDTHNLHWSFGSTPETFDYLAAGECLTLTYTVTANDGHGGTDTQSITVTIEGTNDGPAIVAGGTLNGGVEEESGTYTASGSFGFTDVDSSDSHSVSATPGGLGYIGTLTPSVSDDSTGDGSGIVSWSFSVSNADLQFLGEGETRTQTYTVTVDDGHGGTASQTVTAVLTGDEDPIVITSVAQSKSISEDGTSVGGTIAFNDVDLSDTHTASATANPANTTSLGTFSIDASVTEAANAANGSLGWSYAVDNSAAQYLAVGESVVEKYDVSFNDAHGSLVTETVTVTITGANDGPDISAIAGDTASHDFDETNSGLSTSGTLTVTDPDTSDTIDTSAAIAVSGNQGSLSDGDLLAMFHINGGTDANLAADTGDANNLSWSFDSGSEAFDFLAEGQILTLTYTLTSDDGNSGTDTQDVTITITGTNDAPELSASVTSRTYTDTAADDSFSNLSGTLSTVDPDSGDTATYSVSGGAPDISRLGYDTSASSAYGTLYLNSSSGAYLFVPNDTAIEALKTDDSVGFTLTVTDSQSASDSATLTINIDGANDTPELSATLTSATFTDTAGDDSFSAVTGDLSSTDRDSPDTATYGVIGGVSDNSLSGYDTSKASAFGTLYVDSTTGNYTFVPDDSAIEGLKTNATLFFTLKVTDGSGATDSETLTINIDGVNDTPEAPATNSVTTDEDTASSAVAIGASDRDAGEVLTYSVKTGEEPAHGSVSFNQGAGTFSYTPAADYNGPDSFTVLVTDASGATAEQVVSVTVNAVADIANDSASTNEDTVVTTNVLANDSFEGSPSVTGVTQGAHGSVVNNNDGTVTYTPNADYNGLDSYTYTVTSGGVTETATVNVTINPVADIVADSVTVNANSGANNLNLLGNDNFESAARFISAVGPAAHGTVTINNNGTPGNTADDFAVYTPDSGYTGSDSFTYTVTSGGVTETATVSVTVNAADTQAPTDIVFNLNQASGSFAGNGLGSADTLGTFTAVDADSTSWTFALSGTNASSFTLAPASGLQNTVTLTPSGSLAAGTYTFVVTATDGAGHSYAETYNVSVGTTGADGAAAFTVSNGTDVSFGLNGGDIINGGAGDDALVGGQSSDTISGGAGNDQLIGGAQNDLFVFNTAPNALTNVDTIYDFDAANTPNSDHIQLDHNIFAGIGVSGTLAATDFAANAGGDATNANQNILYDTTTGNLYYDADGNGGGAKILIAHLDLTGLTGTVDASDFIVI